MRAQKARTQRRRATRLVSSGVHLLEQHYSASSIARRELRASCVELHRRDYVRCKQGECVARQPTAERCVPRSGSA